MSIAVSDSFLALGLRLRADIDLDSEAALNRFTGAALRSRS